MNRRDALGLVGASVTGLAAEGTDGRTALQTFDTFLNGFHVPKKDPCSPVEINHHCMRLSDDVLQCVLFQASCAKLLGVEYIITDRRYRLLPLEEKAYWHPHSYDVLAGQLLAPDLPAEREEELMRGLTTTWGKTWLTWPELLVDVPEREPVLLWSLSRDGQVDPAVLADRDRRFHASTGNNRTRRKAFGRPVPHGEPPESVHAIGPQA